MLFRTALKNIRNGLLLNVVAALQMMAAMVITAVLISTILIRFQYYTPMKEYFSANGIYGIFPGMSGKNIQEGMKMDNLLLDDDRLKAELDKPSEVIGSAYTFCFLPNGEGVSSFAYTDNLVQHYTPELSSGRWLSAADDTQSLEVVVSNNKYNWKVGDEITLSFFGAADYKFQIVGMLQENAKIPSGYTNHPDDINYMQFYQTYSFEIEEQPVLLMNLEILKKLHDGPDILRAMTASYIVTYPPNYPEEKLDTERAKLTSFGSAVTIPLSEMQENNIRYLYRQAYDQLPIIIVLLVLTCVSCISSSAITTRRRLRDYSIYYVCGLKWRQCVYVNLIQSLLCGTVSYIASVTALKLIGTSLFHQYRVIWSWYTIGGMGVVLVVYVIASLIMPLMIIGNNTPKQILSR
ncbi:MAG: ABC transporter permease [Oscillospiraceae bacterium]|nr:ABC transporter permease [Oscillospiraceae bacterium]